MPFHSVPKCRLVFMNLNLIIEEMVHKEVGIYINNYKNTFYKKMETVFSCILNLMSHF